jgi:hypothetical protein
MPEEVDLALLQSQLDTVCTDPLWLDDSQLCTEFGDLLDLAEDEEGDDNLYGAAAVLGRLKDRVSEEQASMNSNAFWLLSLNAAQAESNALDSAAAVADQWHVLTAFHGVLSGSWELSDTTQSQGAISGTMPASDHLPFGFLKQVGSSAAFADGSWSVQLDFFGMTANDAGLRLRDITLRRYDSSGSLLESQALAAGTVTTLPSGATRISLTNALSGWSSGSATDFLRLRFYLENDGASAEDYSIRAGVDEGDWGGSWLSQPK